MSAPVTTINRLSCTYLVAGSHRAPDVVRSRLDALAQHHLAERCGSALAGLLDPADPSVWLIRRLDVGLALQLDSDAADLMAQTWARGIAERICDVVSGAVTLPSGDVVWFPDRAAYLASFAVDAVAGQTSGRWEYASLRGVSALPPGRAIITAAEGLQVSIVDVMQQLAATSRLRNLAADIDATEAAQLWERLLTHRSPEHPPSDTARRAVQATCAAHQSAAAGQRALRALATALAVMPPGGTAEDGVALVADIEGWTAAPSAHDVTRSDGETSPDEAEAVRADGAETPRRQPRQPGPETPSAPAQTAGGARVRKARTAPDSIGTPFAGILRLLPVLDDLGWEHLPAQARRQVLARCTGATAAPLAEADPVLSLVAGVDEEGWETPPTDQADGSATDALLATLVRTGRVQGGTIAITTLPNPRRDGQVLLLRDVESSLWLHCGAGVGPRARARALDRVRRCGVVVDSIIDDHDRPAADLDFLGAGHPAQFSAVAQSAVRLFSLRLLGIGRSSVRHLVENLLDGPGVLTDLPDRFEVMVQPSPLQVLLDLGGLDTFEIGIDWLPKPLRVRTFGGRP